MVGIGQRGTIFAVRRQVR